MLKEEGLVRNNVDNHLTNSVITIFTDANDEPSREAEHLLADLHLPVRNIPVERLNREVVMKALELSTGQKQLPVIYFGMEGIGGLKELKDIANKGELESLMKKHSIKFRDEDL